MNLTIKMPSACPVEQAVFFYKDRLLNAAEVVLAYSGGMDSTVLLDVLARSAIPFRAIHVHHGIQPVADAWPDFCREQASKRQINFQTLYVTLPQQSRRGVEDLARQVRYESLWSEVKEGGVLLTAHHQQDQVETFLMRLLRGSGVRGLASIRAEQAMDKKRALLRPLLRVPYQDLTRYANQHQLAWVDDPSNSQEYYSRNLIRHTLLPVFAKVNANHELAIEASILRLQEVDGLLLSLSLEDWKNCALSDSCFSMTAWRHLSWARAKNMLNYIWIEKTGFSFGHKQWDEIFEQFYRTSDRVSHPCLCWREWCLLSDRDLGYVLPELMLGAPSEIVINQPLNQVISLNWGGWGELELITLSEPVILAARTDGDSVIKGERVMRLKHWLDKQHLPAWQKRHWPVVKNESGEVIGWANLPSDKWKVSGCQLRLVFR